MNKLTIEITADGFKETLELYGRKITKRYKRDKSGYEGQNRSWEYEYGISPELVEALESHDVLEVMDALKAEEEAIKSDVEDINLPGEGTTP